MSQQVNPKLQHEPDKKQKHPTRDVGEEVFDINTIQFLD